VVFLEKLVDYRSRKVAVRDHPSVPCAFETLQKRFSEKLTLDELARIAGVRTFHLIPLFSGRLGEPPHAFQNRIRVSQPRRLLLEGRAPAEVATTVGIYDQTRLNQRFKKQFGVTPGEFAQISQP